MEIIRPYGRLVTRIDPEKAIETAKATQGVCIATSSSGRKGMVGMGRAIYDTLGLVSRREPITYAVTLGPKTEQNPYIAELATMAMAMRCLPHHLVGRQITIFTSNLGALLAASQPRHQLGQASIEELYNAAHALRKGGNSISLV
jgi:hypothetical protein